MPSFDIVSKTDRAELDNAISGMRREMETRFDFKGSSCTIERKDDLLIILADDQQKLDKINELVRIYLTRRKLDIGALDPQDPVKASGDALRQEICVKQGIDAELARKIINALKESKIKVQTTIQGNELRISGKKRDDLQAAIAFVRSLGIVQPLQYVNFRD